MADYQPNGDGSVQELIEDAHAALYHLLKIAEPGTLAPLHLAYNILDRGIEMRAEKERRDELAEDLRELDGPIVDLERAYHDDEGEDR
jgi:hypothetical protein